MAAEVPFGSLADALVRAEAPDPAAELESIMRELFTLEEQTSQAADMIERSARELPELADLLNSGLRAPVLAALTGYLDSRAKSGQLRATPNAAASARLVLETLTWFARHRLSDPHGAAIAVRARAGNRRRRPAARPGPGEIPGRSPVALEVPGTPPSLQKTAPRATSPEKPGAPVNAIEVSALTMSYGDREVLRGVDFEVASGEVFCLLGPNGAGKTTTVEILEGFRQRTSGNVTVLGMDPQAQPTKLRERIGIVLQECGFPRQARVKELIDCWRSYYPSPRATSDLLSVVELEEDKNTQVRKLSGGQRRRLDLALALAGRPRPDLPRRAHHRLRPASRGGAAGRRSRTCARSARRSCSPPITWTRRSGWPTGWRSCATARSRWRARSGTSPGRRACRPGSRSPPRSASATAT